MPLTTVIKMLTMDENPGQSQHVVVYSTNSSKLLEHVCIPNRDTLHKNKRIWKWKNQHTLHLTHIIYKLIVIINHLLGIKYSTVLRMQPTLAKYKLGNFHIQYCLKCFDIKNVVVASLHIEIYSVVQGDRKTTNRLPKKKKRFFCWEALEAP